jgi:hypothetical protein
MLPLQYLLSLQADYQMHPIQVAAVVAAAAVVVVVAVVR